MTTIAFDGKCLAVDSQTTDQNVKHFMNKLWKWKRGYFTGAGKLEDYPKFKIFLETGVNNVSPKSEFLYTDKDKVYYCYKGGKVRIKSYWAMGSGAPAALAVMYSGKTAKEAIDIAKQIDLYTGGKTNWIVI